MISIRSLRVKITARDAKNRNQISNSSFMLRLVASYRVTDFDLPFGLPQVITRFQTTTLNSISDNCEIYYFDRSFTLHFERQRRSLSGHKQEFIFLKARINYNTVDNIIQWI